MLMRSEPAAAERLLALAQADADERWRYYTQLAGLERSVTGLPAKGAASSPLPPPPGRKA
jgi:pyruvate-ferredoxin/flavodoxin oxidoreductase